MAIGMRRRWGNRLSTVRCTSARSYARWLIASLVWPLVCIVALGPVYTAAGTMVVRRGGVPHVEPGRSAHESDRARETVKTPEERERDRKLKAGVAKARAKREQHETRQEQHEKERRYLGGDTEGFGDDHRMLVTLTDGRLQFRSNIRGTDTRYAERISEPTLVSLARDHLNAAGVWVSDKDISEKTTFYVDEATFERVDLDLGAARRVFIVPDWGREEPWPVVPLVNGKVEAAVQLSRGLYIRAKQFAMRSAFARWESTEFDSRDLRLLSLVNNSETADAIADSALRNRSIKFDVRLESVPEKQQRLEKLFGREEGHFLVVLGHIEKEEFVTWSESGEELLRVAVAKLEEMAKKHDVRLMLLGCNSAKVSGSTGVAGKFNTIDAVRRLGDALSAKTVSDFLALLCCESVGGTTGEKEVLSLVISEDSTFVSRSRGWRDEYVIDVDVRVSVHEHRYEGKGIRAIRVQNVAVIRLPTITMQEREPDSITLALFRWAWTGFLYGFAAIIVWGILRKTWQFVIEVKERFL